MMTTEDVREMLFDACYEAGSQSAWARCADVSQAYVNDVLRGRREPGEAILQALGLERVTAYRKRGGKAK